MARIYKEENFPLDKVDDVRCSICLDIINNPIGNKNCPHIYCAECISLSCNSKNECPDCKVIFQPQNNKYFELHKLNVLQYHCTNKTNNEKCGAVFPVGNSCRNILNHYSVCEYIEISCNECKKYFPRIMMKNHTNTLECLKYTNDKLKTEKSIFVNELQDLQTELLKQNYQIKMFNVDNIAKNHIQILKKCDSLVQKLNLI
jgi:hypothetical protein